MDHVVRVCVNVCGGGWEGVLAHGMCHSVSPNEYSQFYTNSV